MGPHAVRHPVDLRRSGSRLRPVSRPQPVGPHAVRPLSRRLSSQWRPRTIRRWSSDDDGRSEDIEDNQRLASGGLESGSRNFKDRNYNSEKDEYRRRITKLAFPAVAVTNDDRHLKRLQLHPKTVGTKTIDSSSGEERRDITENLHETKDVRLKKAKGDEGFTPIVVTPLLEEESVDQPRRRSKQLQQSKQPQEHQGRERIDYTDRKLERADDTENWDDLISTEVHELRDGRSFDDDIMEFFYKQ